MSAATSTLIQVRVKPGARVCAFGKTDSGVWLAQLKSQPVDGKANAELIGLVAKHFCVPRSAVDIKSGASGRMKLVRIVGVG